MGLTGNKIQAAMKPHGYQARTVAITHLPEVQEAVGKLVREGLIDKRLSENWHFYLKSNDGLPEARTIIIMAMPSPLTRVWFKYKGIAYPADIPPDHYAKKQKNLWQKKV